MPVAKRKNLVEVSVPFTGKELADVIIEQAKKVAPELGKAKGPVRVTVSVTGSGVPKGATVEAICDGHGVDAKVVAPAAGGEKPASSPGDGNHQNH
jgi:hypothetical protein